MRQVGFTLQPDRQFLDLLEGVAGEGADYFEVAPETLWYFDRQGGHQTNAYYRRILETGRRLGKPFVAHGVGYSVGSASPGFEERRDLWLRAIAATHADFEFLWYTDHLGVTVLDGQSLTLPLAVPMTDAMADHLRGNLTALQDIVPDVGLENSVFYYTLGDPLHEPAFLARVLGADRLHLLLDLHNVHTMAVNLGFEAEAYLDRLPLERVVEIHISGGSDSDPAWLPDGKTMRLDSHDTAVPREVWHLLEITLPRCENLRGVTLERMEGTVGPEDAALLAAELHRVRELVGP